GTGALALARTVGDWAVVWAVPAADPAGAAEAVPDADVAGAAAPPPAETETPAGRSMPDRSTPGAMALTRAVTPAAERPRPVPSLAAAQLTVSGAASTCPEAAPLSGRAPRSGSEPRPGRAPLRA